MDNATLKKLASNERTDFHWYKRASGAGRAGSAARKSFMRRATRRAAKMEFIQERVSMTISKTWILEEAIEFVRKIRPAVNAAGYNLLLGGGVLNNGYSDKDLDLVITPRDVDPDVPKNLSLLEGLNLPGLLYKGRRVSWSNGFCLAYEYYGKYVDVLVFNIVDYNEYN